MDKKGFKSFILAILLVFIAGAAVYYLFSDASDVQTLDFDRTGPRLVALTAVLVVLIISIFQSRPHVREVLRGVLLWGGLGFLLVAGYGFRDDLEAVARRTFAVLVPGTAIDQSDGSVVVIRDGSAHYRVRASINGAEVPFLVDTGASAVTLTADDARKAGFDLERLLFSVPVSTANGRTFVAPVRIEVLEIGSINLKNIRAYVSRDGALETSLLGLSALDRLSSWKVEGAKLILNP